MDQLPGFEALPECDGLVWGIDPSSKRVALAIIEPGNRMAGGAKLHVSTVTLSQIPWRASRFSEGFKRQVEHFKSWTDAGFAPDAIYLEQPYVPRGRGGDFTHLFMYGVTLAALGEVVGNVDVTEIPPQTWKSKALGAGRGRAEKPEIMRWAQARGYAGRSQDEADAIGVACAGAVMRALRSHAAA